MAVGELVVSLLLRTGTFSTDAARSAKDLEKVKKAAYETGRQIGDSLKSIAGALGVGLSVGAFASLIKGSIDAADHLNDLSKKTGIAVDTLGGIGFAAKQAGSDLDSAAAAVGKLNKSIAAARAGDKSALQGFAVVGLEDLIRNGAPAEEVLASLADKFAEFEDGPEKAALAIRIFGKAGADMLPLLNDGGEALRTNIEYFKRYSGVTQEVAASADQFNDTLEKVNLLSSAFGTRLAAEVLPTLQALADEFLDAKENTGLFDTAATAISETLKALVVIGANVGFVLVGIGREIGAIAAQGAALARLDFEGFSAISDAVKEDGIRARKALDDFENRVLNGGSKQTRSFRPSDNYGGATGNRTRAPSLPDIGNADAELKRLLEGRLKTIRDFAKREQDAYQFAQTYVDGVFDDGLISLREKFDAEKQLRDAALASQVRALDAEIAANQTAAKRMSGADRIAIENQIKDAAAKRADVIQQASQADILAAGREAREIRALQDSYTDLLATVKDLKGDAASAAELRTQQAVKSARDLVTRSGGDPAIADEYADLLTKTDQLSQAQRDYNALLEHSRVQEEALLQVAQEGGATEIDTLRALGAQRQKSLEQLGALAAKAQELAETLGTPKAIAFAERLGESFRRASAEVDPLLLKLRGITQELGQGFGDVFGRAIEQGNGLKSILGEIGTLVQRILTEELISKPIGKMVGDLLGGTGSGGGLLGSFLGVGKDNSGVEASAAATTTSFAALQAVGIEPTIAALLRFQTALGASSTTSAASGGGSWMDTVGSFFGSFFGSGSSAGSYGGGGYTGTGGRNEPAGVVHKGEVVFDQQAVKSIGRENLLWMQRNRKLMGGYSDGGYVSDVTARVYSRPGRAAAAGQAGTAGGQPLMVTNNFVLNTPADRRTQQMIAAEAGRGVQRAQSRNN